MLIPCKETPAILSDINLGNLPGYGSLLENSSRGVILGTEAGLEATGKEFVRNWGTCDWVREEDFRPCNGTTGGRVDFILANTLWRAAKSLVLSWRSFQSQCCSTDSEALLQVDDDDVSYLFLQKQKLALRHIPLKLRCAHRTMQFLLCRSNYEGREQVQVGHVCVKTTNADRG